MKSDLTGKRFGRWTVIYKVENRGRRVFWFCRCDCGTEKEIAGDSLYRGSSKSCGCYKKDKLKDRLIDLTGKRFGKLFVLYLSSKKGKNREAFWECLCDCGSRREVNGHSLTSGHTLSCGCYGRKKASEANRIECGLAAKRRVYNNTYKSGAKKKGLLFDLSFKQFLELTQQSCHYCGSKPLTVMVTNNGVFKYNGIDRIDNTKGYTIKNCATCCIVCNRAKKDMTYGEFIEWGKNLGKNLSIIKGENN